MSQLLSVSHLKVRYALAGGWIQRARGLPAHVDVLKGVSLTLQRGQTLAVVGESGSGKTTLALALCGLAPVAEGEVLFQGQPLQQDRRQRLLPERRQLGMVFQDAVDSLSPRMTIGALIAEPLQIHGTARDTVAARVDDLLNLVGLDPGFKNRYPHQLSGGQARRVGVARALALEPALLIADEPTAGLDVSIQGGVLNLLADIRDARGLGVLIITHNLNIVRHVADHIAVMYLGRFVETGPVDVVLNAPGHPYTAALLAANPSMDAANRGQRETLQGEVPSLATPPPGCAFQSRCKQVVDACRQSLPEMTTDEQAHGVRCIRPLTP